MSMGDLLPMIMGFINDQGQQQATNQANAQNEQRYGEGVGLLNQLGQSTIPDANAFAELQNQRLADILSTGQEGFGQLTQGYQDRYKRGMSMLEGMGNQERRDINTNYDNLGAQTHDYGVGRGLSGTTVMPGLQRGVARGRSDALGRLDETLRQQQIGLDTQLSGDYLGAMGAANAFDINQMGQNFGAYGQVEGSRLAPQYDLTNQMLGWIGGRNDVAPAESPFLNTQMTLGQGAGPAYSAPEQSNAGLWSSLIGGGTTLGGAGIVASAL